MQSGSSFFVHSQSAVYRLLRSFFRPLAAAGPTSLDFYSSMISRWIFPASPGILHGSYHDVFLRPHRLPGAPGRSAFRLPPRLHIFPAQFRFIGLLQRSPTPSSWKVPPPLSKELPEIYPRYSRNNSQLDDIQPAFERRPHPKVRFPIYIYVYICVQDKVQARPMRR